MCECVCECMCVHVYVYITRRKEERSEREGCWRVLTFLSAILRQVERRSRGTHPHTTSLTILTTSAHSLTSLTHSRDAGSLPTDSEKMINGVSVCKTVTIAWLYSDLSTSFHTASLSPADTFCNRLYRSCDSHVIVT